MSIRGGRVRGRGRLVAPLLLATLLAGVLSGCGGGGRAAAGSAIQVAPDLVAAATGAVGTSARTLEIPVGAVDDWLAVHRWRRR